MSHKIVIDELNNVVQITAPGPQGVQGPAGTTLRYGAGAPTAGDGNNGDFWVDTTNDRLYGPKAAGAWPAEYTSLIGPANTLTIGTVTTGPTNGTAAASISGTAPNQVLDLTLPAGPTGPAINLGSALPLPLGAVALSGTATAGSREDHVHSSSGVTVTLLQAYVKNGSGGALSKGAVVYISGADGSNVLISKADANSDPSSSKTLGLLSQDLAINELGYVTTEGIVAGINTASATAGQSVWLSTTAGEFVFGSPPAEPAHSVYLGVVARANANNGEILVKVQNGYELDELHDVFAGSPTNGHLLRYDASSTAWINGQALGTSIAAGAIGSDNIAVGAVGGTHIAVGGVAGTNIANTTITAGKINSESATSNQYLGANGSGGASWNTIQGPSVVTTNATAIWTKTTLAQTTYVGLPGSTSNHLLGITGAGTVFTMNGNVSATNRPVRVWNTLNLTATVSGSVAASTSGTIQPVVAGTVGASNFQPVSTYFSANAASSALFFAEWVDATTTGNDTLSIRRYTRDLVTNTWNAAIVSNGTGTTAVTTINNSWNERNFRYVPESDTIVGYYGQNNAYTLFAVNATSGSVYTAAIGTGAYSSNVLEYGPKLDLYVPGLAGANGTVHVFGTGYLGGTAMAFRQQFTMGSASLTAGTIQWAADFMYGFGPNANTPGQYNFTSNGAYWDANATAIVLSSSIRKNGNYELFVGYDRTFGTVLFRSISQIDMNLGNMDTRYPGDGFYRMSQNGQILYQTGYANDYYAPAGSVYFASTIDDASLAGAGSPTHHVYSIDGTAYAEPLNNYRTTEFALFGTASAARLVSAQAGVFNEFEIMSVRGTGITKFNDAGQPDDTALSLAGAANFPMLATAAGSVTVVLKSMDTDLRVGTVTIPVTEIRFG